MTKASHQSLRKDIMTFFDYMIYLSVIDEYAFSGRTINMLPFKGLGLPRMVNVEPVNAITNSFKLFRLFRGIEQV
jgi:hypothetical protein